MWNIPYAGSTQTVDIVDAHNNMLVWRGYDTGTIDLNKADKTIENSRPSSNASSKRLTKRRRSWADD
jgi:hypothetical protein